jgi:hypothetical protein
MQLLHIAAHPCSYVAVLLWYSTTCKCKCCPIQLTPAAVLLNCRTAADVVGGCMLASSEARFSWGLASLLGAAPFYAPGAQQLLQKLGPVMEQAQVDSKAQPCMQG